MSGGGEAGIDATMREATRALAEASSSPRLDAELLMAHALGTTRETLLLGGGAAPAPAGFAALLARRLAHEPMAYITGRRDFWSIELVVTPDVLVPRADSETLIEAAVAHFTGRAPPARILDLGTGSGALLLAALAEWPAATGTGIDRSPAALAVARDNARRLGLADRARFAEGDWQGDAAADLVLCNPPYVGTGEALPPDLRHEPAIALFAGPDGLDDYRRIAGVIDFAPGGCACIEIGATQWPAVSGLFVAAGLHVRVRPDLAGRDRCILLTKS